MNEAVYTAATIEWAVIGLILAGLFGWTAFKTDSPRQRIMCVGATMGPLAIAGLMLFWELAKIGGNPDQFYNPAITAHKGLVAVILAQLYVLGAVFVAAPAFRTVTPHWRSWMVFIATGSFALAFSAAY